MVANLAPPEVSTLELPAIGADVDPALARPKSLKPQLAFDLGSGPNPEPGFTGVDLIDDIPGVIPFDLFSGQPWPWEDNSVSRLRASHVIEHIPAELVHTGEWRTVRIERRDASTGTKIRDVKRIPVRQDALFRFFDEAYRVLEPGGTFELAWPDAWCDGAVQDPTHYRQLPLAFLNYLTLEGRRNLRVTQYVVACDFEVVQAYRLGPQEVLAEFTKEAGGTIDNPDWDAIGKVAARHINGFNEIKAVLRKPVRLSVADTQPPPPEFTPPPGWVRPRAAKASKPKTSDDDALPPTKRNNERPPPPPAPKPEPPPLDDDLQQAESLF